MIGQLHRYSPYERLPIATSGRDPKNDARHRRGRVHDHRNHHERQHRHRRQLPAIHRPVGELGRRERAHQQRRRGETGDAQQPPGTARRGSLRPPRPPQERRTGAEQQTARSGEGRQVQEVGAVRRQRSWTRPATRSMQPSPRPASDQDRPPAVDRCAGCAESATRSTSGQTGTTAPPPPGSTGGAAARSCRSTARRRRSDPSWRSRRCPAGSRDADRTAAGPCRTARPTRRPRSAREQRRQQSAGPAQPELRRGARRRCSRVSSISSEVIRKPETTKNTSTPRNPPCIHANPAW